MELVTGRKGTPHVTSQQDRMLNQGIFGEGSYILATGQQLEPQVQSSNEIRIRDGAIMAQGALGCVKVNTYDSVTIQNGNQGMKRIDLICWQYTYDAEQDVESASWVVVQGTPAETDPEVPAHTEGNIQEGDTLVQIPVFAVNIDGINVTGVDVLLNVAMDMSTANAYLSELNENSVILERTDIISDSSYSYEYFIYREKNTRYIKMFGKWVGTVTGTSLGGICYGNISNLRLIPSIQDVTLERIINIIFAGGNSGSIFAPANYNGASVSGNIVNVSTINYLMTYPPREITLTWEILCKIA